MPLPAVLQQMGQDLLDLVFPPSCAVCGEGGALLCGPCLGQLPRLIPPLCVRCGRPMAGASECRSCRQAAPAIDGIRSVLLLANGAREAVHHLKYGGRSSLAAPLARLMSDYWRTNPLPADVVVAVPLHIARQRERGYNQAHLLAREFGRMVGLPSMSGTLKRARNTPAQVGLDASQRHANVCGAFVYHATRHGDGVGGRRVLLVDDVCTTGATLEACSAALREAGAASVWGFTLARAA
jgi:ComF family protein